VLISAQAAFANEAALTAHPATAHLFGQWFQSREGFGAMPKGARGTTSRVKLLANLGVARAFS
jgi:hypothetical protein